MTQSVSHLGSQTHNFTESHEATHKLSIHLALEERLRSLDLLDLRVGECDVEGLDVALELLDLAAADDGEDVRGLLHHVRNCH